jgi:hypothetical protein
MSVKFLGRDLVYRELVTDAVFRFVPDRLSSAPYSFDTYPRMAESNDEPLSIAPCSDSGNRLVRYMTGPDEKFVVECLDGYYEDGAPLDTGGNILYALGYNQLALASGGILDLSDGSVRPHAAGGAFVAARAYEGGFYAAFGPVSEPMLWDVSASGDAVHLGDYPPLDGVHLSDTSRLGPDQALYDLISGEQEEVVRRTADGDREIIYSETTDPLVRAVPFSSTVVTGP